MKKGISYWSFQNSGLSAINAIDNAKIAGFEGIELTLEESGDTLTLNSTDAQVKDIAGYAKEKGVSIPSIATGMFWSNSLTANNDSVAKKAFDIAVRELELAAVIGAKTVLIVPGAVDVFFLKDAEIVSYDVVYARSLKAVSKLAKIAEKLKVNIGLEEVWNKFLLSPLEMRDFIDKIGSKFVGSYFDVGNVVPFGFPEQWIRILGHRVKAVHLKDFKNTGFDGKTGLVDGFCDLETGDVNWKNVISALKDIKYDGYLIAEMVPPTSNVSRENLIPKTSKAMDHILSL
ncbi:MAG: sugar phosphate isomerase/epimerase family protein [Elusimicrobiota bacterium]